MRACSNSAFIVAYRASFTAPHSSGRPDACDNIRPLVERKSDTRATAAARSPLRKRGIRLTRQRELLFEIINNAHDHLNADQLYELAKKTDPKINRVTVYRTLKLLKNEGLIDELDLMHFEGEQHYYETRLKQEHAHIVCLRCGAVQEFFGDPLRHLREQIESGFGFQILVSRSEVGGYCADCQNTLPTEELLSGDGEPSPSRRKALRPRSRSRAGS